MRPELRTEMLRILEEASKGESVLMMQGEKRRKNAASILEAHGALRKNNSSYRITASGLHYYDELKSPKVYWLKNNWFPVAVLVVTSVVTVVANVIGALLD